MPTIVWFVCLFTDPISFSSPSFPVLSTKRMITLPLHELFPMLHVLHTEKNVCRPFWWSECSIPVLPHYFRDVFHFTRPIKMLQKCLWYFFFFFFPEKTPSYLKSTNLNSTITLILKKNIGPPTNQRSIEEIQLMWQPSKSGQTLVKRKHPIDNAEDTATFSCFSSASTEWEQLFCIRPKILQPLDLSPVAEIRPAVLI